MTTITAMEQRRRRALLELHGLLELQMERELLPREMRLLRKWSGLVEEMDDRLRDMCCRVPGVPVVPLLFGPTAVMLL